MKKLTTLFLSLFLIQVTYARQCKLPEQWENLCPILQTRIEQTSPKMKLEEREVVVLEQFLTIKNDLPSSVKNLNELQKILPKTTIELLMALKFRGVSINNAEWIAHYLNNLVSACQFENMPAFDENTSHIIGREWHEIDYSGEGMTWENQKAQYAPYDITNFKTLDNIEKFFPIESKMPYFKKIYKPITKCNI